MFQVDRARQLNDISWHEGGSLFFVQGYQHPNAEARLGSNYEKGHLLDHEVDDWLEQKGRFAPPNVLYGRGKTLGGFRLLICERPKQNLPGLAMSRASFLQLESAFKLSSATLPSLMAICGVHSRRYNYKANTDTLESLDIIIKVTQKVEIANSLLSLNHDFDTNWTTAFLCGEGVTDSMGVDSYGYGSRLDHLLGTIECCVGLWSNPLFLPVAILRNCCSRTARSADRISDALVRLEIDVGVTLTGQAGHLRPRDDWPANVDIKSATFRLHNVNAQAIFVGYVSSWACDCIRFLVELGAEVDVHMAASKRTTAMLREHLEHELSSMTNIDRFITGYKERIQAQINVLYSAASQVDNATAISYSRIAQMHNELARKDTQMNTKIAMLTKRDSVAMIAFTFITALFLPGTAIATLLSMPMFDWESSRSHVTVSTSFWVYWVVTIPLTLAVLAGWYLWYKHKNQQWQKETAAEVSNESEAVKE